MGTGKDALRWAGDVNDKEFIDLALNLEPKKMLTSASENYNACGAGAAAQLLRQSRRQRNSEGMKHCCLHTLTATK
jgi:hypothetical protein